MEKQNNPEKSSDVPMAKKDANGTLVTDKKQLERLYVDFYTERMSPNDMKEGLKDMEFHKERLFKLRMEISSRETTPDWTIDELEKVLKTLKTNKARDCFGHTYELFKFGGLNLKLSMLVMFLIPFPTPQ